MVPWAAVNSASLFSVTAGKHDDRSTSCRGGRPAAAKAKETTMRTRTVAATTLLLALALATAGCARNGTNDPQVASAQAGGATASASPSATPSDDPDAPIKFSRCMREHGISWFPDPKDGKMSIMVPRGQDKKKFDAAQEACKQFMPNGGEMRKPSAEDLEQARQMAKCMRENGVPDFPDPNPEGGISIDGDKMSIKPDSPTWKKAEQACSQYIPKGAQKRQVRGGGARA
jgi:hypothetical protein